MKIAFICREIAKLSCRFRHIWISWWSYLVKIIVKRAQNLYLLRIYRTVSLSVFSSFIFLSFPEENSTDFSRRVAKKSWTLIYGTSWARKMLGGHNMQILETFSLQREKILRIEVDYYLPSPLFRAFIRTIYSQLHSEKKAKILRITACSRDKC